MSRNFWRCWRLCDEAHTHCCEKVDQGQRIECCSCIFNIRFKGNTSCLERQIHRLNCSTFCAFFFYVQLITYFQLFSLWFICFRHRGAWTFLWILHVTVCSSVVSMARSFSLHFCLYLISICSPNNQRWKTALLVINNLLPLIGWLNLLINILVTFHWQNKLRDLS